MRRVVFAVVPPVQILDLTGPYEVFARCGGYRVELVSAASRVESSCGLALTGARPFHSLRGSIDTLLVPGGDGAEHADCDPAFLRWLAAMHPRVRRIGSICTGAFALAAAGILDRRRAVTHWAWCDELARRYPRVRVERDPIFIRDGRVYTSAGVTAGIDLALALVEEDHGRKRALEIARHLVMFLRRPGGQSQFSRMLSSQVSSLRPIEDLQHWILDHLAHPLDVETLAARCAMSPRHFARVFAAGCGITPARFVEQSRVEAARLLLEDSSCSMKEAAARAGFGNADSMRRAFLRVLAVAPADYAARFRRKASEAGAGGNRSASGTRRRGRSARSR